MFNTQVSYICRLWRIYTTRGFRFNKLCCKCQPSLQKRSGGGTVHSVEINVLLAVVYCMAINAEGSI
jgi:hypothetical protein